MTATTAPAGAIQNPIAAWPRWVQITSFAAALLAGLVAFEYVKHINADSPRATAIKRALGPLAEQLITAQKVGDRAAAVAVSEPITKILTDFNRLSDSDRAAIDASPLRYCKLASIHIAAGVSQVADSGVWTSRDVYQAAISQCK